MMQGQVALKALAVLASVCAFGFMVAWYGFLEPSWLSYPEGSRFPVERAEIKPGEVVPLRVARCNTSGEKQLYLIGGSLIRLDQPPEAPVKPVVLAGAPVLIQPGCAIEGSRANVIPADTAPGVYFIDGLSVVNGRWRSTNVEWSSEPFRVAAP